MNLTEVAYIMCKETLDVPDVVAVDGLYKWPSESVKSPSGSLGENLVMPESLKMPYDTCNTHD